jgi:3D (Asp-Asp-Asp) domain-containing protein
MRLRCKIFKLYMEVVLGKHLGWVINTNDPEGRQRVQVFIPYLTNTLYSSWNQELKDTAFKNPLELGDKILLTLRKTLPWAECAMGIFGGGTAMKANPSSGRITVNGGSTLPDNLGAGAGGRALNPIDPYNEYAPLPQLTGKESQTTSNTKIVEFSDGTIDPLYTGEILPGMKVLTENGPESPINADIDKPENTTPLLSDTVAGRTSSKPIINSPYTVYSLGRSVGGADETQDSWTNKGYSSTGQNLTPGVVAVNTSVYPLGTIFRDPNSGYVYIAADRHGNKDPSVVDFYLTPSQYGLTKGSTPLQVIGSVPRSEIPSSANGIRSLLSQYGSVPPGESATEWFSGNRQNLTDSTLGSGSVAGSINPEDSTAVFNPDVIGTQGSVPDETLGGNGSPNGTFSVPTVGSKVWVFFYGGDIQRPVYFAAVVEPSAARTI